MIISPDAENISDKIQRPSLIKTLSKLGIERKFLNFISTKPPQLDFPCGAVVKNPPTNAGDTGSSPGPGRSHMPRSD